MTFRWLGFIGAPLCAGLLTYFIFVVLERRAVEPSGPEIEFPTTVDFGRCELGEVVTQVFKVRNNGTAELVVDDIRTDCSCAGLEAQSNGKLARVESLRLNAGEAVELTMRVAVRSTPVGGKASIFVLFKSNDPRRQQCRIEGIIDRVSGGAVMYPQSISFGSVPIGSKVRRIIEVRDTSNPPRSIESVKSSSPQVVLIRHWSELGKSPIPNTDPPETVVGKIEVTIDASRAEDVLAQVDVALTGRERLPDSVRVFGRVVAPFSLAPSTITLPRLSSNGPIYSATVICQSNDGASLQIAVKEAPKGIEVRIPSGSSASQLVEVVWDRKDTGKMLTGTRQILRLLAKSEGNTAALDLPLLLQE